MFVEADPVRLNSVAIGAGPTTFVAHGGWVGNWELWQQPFEMMQERWRCVAYDHRGAGVSRVAPSDITPEALVDDLFRILDAYGIERCVLAGESLGSLTCLLAAQRDPSRFLGLVLVDGMPAVTPEGVAALVNGSRTDFPATVQWFIDACVPEPDADHIRLWGRQILLRADPECAARILEVHANPAVAPDLSALDLPTLLVHGEIDAIVPVHVAESVAATLRRSTLVRIPGAGHVPTLSHPHAVVAAIEEWWSALASN
jgi:pimeloyl-ACP methyl ester carboxylesterase